jgi:hypothetical protein
MWIFYGNEILHVCGYWKTIFFRQLWATPILVDHETSCGGKLISLSSMHMKNVQIGERMRPVHEFEGTVVLDSELEINMGSK